MGLLAAGDAMATVLGTFLAGPLVETLGYRVVPLIASAAVLMAKREREIGRSQAADGAGRSVTAGQPRPNAAPRPRRSSEKSGFRREPGTEKN
jgi:hypothetical protein